MDAYDEQRLRDEVIYLHSLWHQGPSRSTSTTSANGHLHHLLNRNQFKRRRAKCRAQRGNGNNRNQEVNSTESTQESGKEWPCDPTFHNVAPASAWPTGPAQSISKPSWHSSESVKEWPCNSSSATPTQTSPWPTLSAQQNSQPVSLSPEQQARLAANRAQGKALRAIKDYFRSDNSDDDDDHDHDHDLAKNDDDDTGVDENEDHDDLTRKYGFFAKVFEEDNELREYYRENYKNGNFSCLVCCGVGLKKASKKFKDCVALIQHSVSIAKTKKRHAHRAYGKVVCNVLGWDIHDLPTIVSALTAKDSISLSNSGTSEGEAQRHVDETKDNTNVRAQADIGNGDELQEKESTGNKTKLNNDEPIVSQENSLIVAGTSKFDEDPNFAAPNIVEGEGSGQPSDFGYCCGR